MYRLFLMLFRLLSEDGKDHCFSTTRIRSLGLAPIAIGDPSPKIYSPPNVYSYSKSALLADC